MDKPEYCVGLWFTEDRRHVLLQQKARPSWQKGLLNGPGGGIERGETPIVAMVREFKEETGLKTSLQDWEIFLRLTTPSVHVWCMRMFKGTVADMVDLPGILNPVDEPVVIVDVPSLPSNLYKNVRWMIPMALDTDVDVGRVVIREQGKIRE